MGRVSAQELATSGAGRVPAVLTTMGGGGLDRAGRKGADGSPRQAALPALRSLAIGGGETPFAHPAEEDFARLLTYYGIRWVYEPTTFALTPRDNGETGQSFTPDFYLPDHRLYIELTTMRQRLVTRKNRKLRCLRALYPNVRIKLLYRRDYLRLVDAYPGASGRPDHCAVGKVLLPEAVIRDRVGALAAEIVADLRRPDANRCGTGRTLLLAVGGGDRRFFADLGDALGAFDPEIERDRVEVTRYRIVGGLRRVRVRWPPILPLAGRRVVVVADIVNTGLSLAYLLGWLRRRGAASVDVCALLDRRAARLVDVPIRYCGFEAPSELLVGYGLPLHREYQKLPHVAMIEPG